MLKRKEFILGAAAGLALAAGATAGGLISWPVAAAQTPGAVTGRVTPSPGGPNHFAPPPGAPVSFADIFDQVAPAVVQIDVRTRVQRPRGGLTIPGFPFQLPSPGEDGEGSGDDSTTTQGAGSGFFISRDGYIVTNNHVVANAEEITVRLSDQREMKATLIGRDEATDLAVIKVEGDAYPFVSFEDSAEPRVGDWVIAVGNPFGLGGTATVGIVSARGRDIGGASTPMVDYLQIDAAINRGNSGGPTFDVYGRVIGVNTAIFSPTGGSVGIGFAVPAATAKTITEQLMRGETIQRGYLGVTIGPITAEYQEALGLSSREGAYIVEVNPGGPGAQGGLQAGDIVLTVDGQAVRDHGALTRRVGQTRPGDVLRLGISRDGRERTIEIRSGTRPSETELNSRLGRQGADSESQGPAAEPGSTVVEGLNLAPLSPALRERYSIPSSVEGVVVAAQGRGENARVPAGAVILRAGDRNVRSVADVQAAVEESRRAGRSGVLLLIRTPQGNAPYVLKLSAAD